MLLQNVQKLPFEIGLGFPVGLMTPPENPAKGSRRAGAWLASLALPIWHPN